MAKVALSEAAEERLIALQKEHVAALQETWICPGPNRVDGYAGTKPDTGKSVTYGRCMHLADCSCARFQRQADRVQRLEEEMEDLMDPNRPDDDTAF